MNKEEIEVTLGAPESIFASPLVMNIRNCLAVIARTRVCTVPLRRHFGTLWKWVDLPLAAAKAKYRAELFDAIDKWEPRIEVTSITFKEDESAAAQGRLLPVVRFKLKEEVET